jgi:hypothetical protein
MTIRPRDRIPIAYFKKIVSQPRPEITSEELIKDG